MDYKSSRALKQYHTELSRLTSLYAKQKDKNFTPSPITPEDNNSSSHDNTIPPFLILAALVLLSVLLAASTASPFKIDSLPFNNSGILDPAVQQHMNKEQLNSCTTELQAMDVCEPKPVVKPPQQGRL